MRERMSPRAVLRRVRSRLPDTLMALQEVPKIFQTFVREAADGNLRLPVENTELAQLRCAMQRRDARRDAAIGAAVLWLSGLIWLGMSTTYRWLGWLQMLAAIVIFVSYRSSRRSLE